MKQTAVEWLVDYIKNLEKYPYKTIQELEEQAKEMEKQQLKEMYLKGIENYDSTFNKREIPNIDNEFLFKNK
jgi:hypothetical protein